jgi:5'-3' exonuclease
MGVSGFWKSIKGVPKPFVSENDLLLNISTPVLVDGANALAIVWNNMAKGLLYFQAKSISELDAIAEELATGIFKLIRSTIGERKTGIVFDGQERELRKLKASDIMREQIKARARAARADILGCKSRSSATLMTRNLLPRGVLYEKIMLRLAKNFTVYQAKGEADFVISSLLRHEEWANAAIISGDSDFLVFTDVEFLINPISRYRSVTAKSEVLEKLKIDKESLKVCAAYSGQDHIAGISQFGFTKSIAYLKGAIKLKPDKSVERNESLMQLIRVVELFASEPDYKIVDSNWEFEFGPVISLLETFLNETHSVNGVITFRRPGLRQRYLQGRTPSTIKSNVQWRQHARKQREEEMDKKVKKKTFFLVAIPSNC